MTATDTTVWKKASRSGGNGNCVEVKQGDGAVLIRDSKYRRDASNDPAVEPMITLTPAQWTDFLSAVVGDAPSTGEPTISRMSDGTTTLHSQDGTTLTYTPAEWEAFTAAVIDGEFGEPMSATASITAVGMAAV